MNKLIRYAVFVILTVLVVGCSLVDDDEATPRILSITPPENANEIAKTVSVEIEFNQEMDTESCQTRFGLFQGNLDAIPVNLNGRMHGGYTWNNDHTMMTFTPDSMLTDSTMFSICLQEGMRLYNHGGGMMMGGMRNHGMETTSGIITLFKTR
ncbi:MAG: Ig-like domain-containing protein [Candidatus Marinimicrobia bacterium]|nr:Ig-like domain-containing protein [Candidatus Neomarinimicrobiota bacterium]